VRLIRPAASIGIAVFGASFLIWFAVLHWSAEVSLVPAACLAVATLFALRPRSGTPEPVIAAMPVPTAEPRKEQVAGVLLPSMHEDYCFQFAATVLWEPTGTIPSSPANMPALAVETILRRARRITEQQIPGNSSLVQHELASALGEMHADATGRLQAMAESVHVVLPENDQQRLDKLAAVRKDEAIWEHERRYEQNRRHYLSTDVLKDPGSTVVWWLARNDDQVDKTVEDIGRLARLFAAANNTNLPDALRQLVPELASAYASGMPPFAPDHPDAPGTPSAGKSAVDHFGAFLQAIDLIDGDPERTLFARRVADFAAAHKRQGVADEIISRFDNPEDAAPPPEADDAGSPIRVS
jgi:hypothetical protein